MKELDTFLKHYGVKGMQWGVRKDRERGKIGQHLDSLKRERQWSKITKSMDLMSTDEIRRVTSRISLENNLKRLSKSKVANSKDKSDYLNRAKMSDADLAMKVTRLNAKDSLAKAAKNASKEQRDFGVKVVEVGSTIAIKYATNKSISPKDVFDSVSNPMKTKAIKDAMKDDKSSNGKSNEEYLRDFMEKYKPKK